jgi:hypothetical protein
MGKALKVRFSKSFDNSLLSYKLYKHSELVHFISKLKKITRELEKIAIQKKHLSKKVQYSNSKGLNYFVVEQHAVFFKITKTQLQVKYFVAVKRIKKPLGISK